MIEVQTEDNGRRVVVQMSGLITESEIDHCSDLLAESVGAASAQTVLLDWTELQGWAKGAKTVGTWVGMRHWGGVRRVAVLADAAWEDETLRIADIYKVAEVRRFPAAERADAIAWLASA